MQYRAAAMYLWVPKASRAAMKIRGLEHRLTSNIAVWQLVGCCFNMLIISPWKSTFSISTSELLSGRGCIIDDRKYTTDSGGKDEEQKETGRGKRSGRGRRMIRKQIATAVRDRWYSVGYFISRVEIKWWMEQQERSKGEPIHKQHPSLMSLNMN